MTTVLTIITVSILVPVGINIIRTLISDHERISDLEKRGEGRPWSH